MPISVLGSRHAGTDSGTGRLVYPGQQHRPEPRRQIAAVGSVEETFTDRVSGGSRVERTALTTMLRHVRRGDTVRVASMDRLARSVVATFQLHLLGAVAQLERSLIRERQREGIAIARANGVYRGRARTLTDDQVTEATHLAAAGVPQARIARDLDCSRRVLYDALTARGAYATPTSAPTTAAALAPDTEGTEEVR